MSSRFKKYNPISTGTWVPKNLSKNNKKINRTYNIFIKDLKLMAFIGIHDFEKDKKQKISINIELEAEENFKNLGDNVDKVVSYEYIVNDIKKLVNSGHVGLLETLAEQISMICFADERVLFAKIKIEKLDVFEETKSVGIEILRKKSNLKKTVNILKIKK
tara:strand:- start:170 stop:652 length:483 start_codon:yes stop_codon:yes gene_type:complete